MKSPKKHPQQMICLLFWGLSLSLPSPAAKPDLNLQGALRGGPSQSRCSFLHSVEVRYTPLGPPPPPRQTPGRGLQGVLQLDAGRLHRASGLGGCSGAECRRPTQWVGCGLSIIFFPETPASPPGSPLAEKTSPQSRPLCRSAIPVAGFALPRGPSVNRYRSTSRIHSRRCRRH